MSGLIVDLFAGGGGASTGLEAATGRRVDIAINHDAVALETHKRNHPETRHLEADIWEVRPREAVGGRKVWILWASPDCTHFSVAKGGKPRQQNIRSLAWAVTRWAADVRPDIIFLENVSEFRGWGPLDAEGRPVKKKMGETFRRWKARLEKLGYAVDFRILDASHYGAPTKRKRLFLIARCDGQPIRWPAQTHGGMGLLPVRTAAECIDWSIPCPSIFERKRPLAEKTLWRIAQGIRRFVLETPHPFIVGVGGPSGQGRPASVKEPFGTILAENHRAVVAPNLIKVNHGGADARGERADQPLSTVTASRRGHATSKDRLGLVTVNGTEYQITDIGMRMLEPHELLAAQFGRFAETYDLSAATSKAAQVRLIGNSVCPEVAEAIVAANLHRGSQRSLFPEAA